jgi:glutathione S-transferase
MLLYDSIGPNPRVVRIFMAERGIELPKTTVDLRGGENRQPPYLAKNPAGQMPCLELDDGSVLAEITAVCEYLDEITPGASLIGATPRERAECRMWTRRIDLNIIEPMANGYRFSQGLALFESRLHCIPQAAEDLKVTAQKGLAWLDGLITGRTFIRGESLSLADIMLFAFLDFGAKVGQPIDPALAEQLLPKR